jgi:predicted nucleic acid-binding protein
MRDVVIDRSVAAKWFLAEPHSDKALDILEAKKAKELALLAPEFIYAEVGNILWRRVSSGTLADADAQLFIDDFSKIQFTLVSSASLLRDAYTLAVAHKRTVYDSLYLALSLRAKCELVTADARLFNAIGARFSDIVLLANWS